MKNKNKTTGIWSWLACHYLLHLLYLQLQNLESEGIDDSELKGFIQAHVPEARLKETQGGDVIYSLPPFTSSNAASYRSLLTALDSNLDALQLGCYGISDTTLEEVRSYAPSHENSGLKCSQTEPHMFIFYF